MSYVQATLKNIESTITSLEIWSFGSAYDMKKESLVDYIEPATSLCLREKRKIRM